MNLKIIDFILHRRRAPGFRIFAGSASRRLSLDRRLEMRQGRSGALLVSNEGYSWKRVRGPLFIEPEKEANAHILISGSSGYGKSTLLCSMLADIAEAGKPILLFDGHGEHSGLVKALGGRVYEGDASGINIFELDGLTIAQRIDRLASLLSEVFGLGYLQRSELGNVLYYTYRKLSADMANNLLQRAPRMNDLMDELSIFIRNAKSLGERNRLKHILYRIAPLRGGAGTLPGMADLSKGVNAISLNSIRSAEAKAIYIHEIIERLYGGVTHGGIWHGVRSYVAIDEGRKAMESAGSIIGSIVSESRKFGYGVIIVTNSMATLPKEIVANSSVLIAFHSNEPTEINYVANAVAKGNSMKSQPVRSMLEGLRKHQALFVSYGTPIQHVLRTATHEEVSRRLAGKAAVAADAAHSPSTFQPQPRVMATAEGLTPTAAHPPSTSQSPSPQPDGPACAPVSNPVSAGTRSRAVSYEHDMRVTAISDALEKMGIRHYVSKGQGPDVVAYAKVKVAIEYETGRKSFGASYGMILSRRPEYGLIIVVVNDLYYGRYSGISRPGIAVFRFSELDKAISAVGEDL